MRYLAILCIFFTTYADAAYESFAFQEITSSTAAARAIDAVEMKVALTALRNEIGAVQEIFVRPKMAKTGDKSLFLKSLHPGELPLSLTPIDMWKTEKNSPVYILALFVSALEGRTHVTIRCVEIGSAKAGVKVTAAWPSADDTALGCSRSRTVGK